MKGIDIVDSIGGYTFEDYKAAPVLVMPWVAQDMKNRKTGKPFTFTKLTGKCQKCGESPAIAPRGTIREYASCFELEYGCMCENCNLVTLFHYRVYPNDNRMLMMVDGKWEETTYVKRKQTSMGARITAKFLRVLKYIIDL